MARLWLRKVLTKLLRKTGDGIRLSEHLATTDGDTLFEHACAMGLTFARAKHDRSSLLRPISESTH
jgi:hypothetical protein